MASLNTLIGTLSQAMDRPTLEPRFNTGEIPEQADFYGLIHTPMSRLDDGIFKTLDNPLCIRSADGDTNKNILHFYDDATSDPVWELTIENDHLNINNAGGDKFTFESGGDFTVKAGDINIENGNLNLTGSSGNLTANQLTIGNTGTSSQISLSQNTGLSVRGQQLLVEDADLSLRAGSFHRWRFQTDNNQLRFRNVYNGSGVLQNTDRLLLKDNGEVEVPSGPLHVNVKRQSSGPSIWSNNLDGVSPTYNWAPYSVGMLAQVGSTSGDHKYAIFAEASGDSGVKYGAWGYAKGDGSQKYGIRGDAVGTGSNYAIYGNASGGTTDYAGYFVGDRVYMSGSLGLGTASPGNDKLDVRGRAYASGGWQTTNADYGELFEASGGKSIPQGTSVVFTRGGKIRPAKEGETPFGIVTKNSAVVGNSYREWPGKYERDEFGNQIMEKIDEIVEALDPNNPEKMTQQKTGKKILAPKISKNYNPKKEYTPREDRAEWAMVGLLGQLRLKKGQPVASSWVLIKKISDELDLYLVK
jgi:hypothetical protein